MKGGNLSQLNDYAMTHPACGECKHCKMQEKDQGQTLLISHFQLRLQISRFLQVTHDFSSVYWGGYTMAVTRFKNGRCWCQRTGGIPGILNLFPTQV